MLIDAAHQSRTAKVYSDTISLVALATIAVVLRFVARRIAGSKLWWDDWILVVALIFDYGLSVCYWLQVKYGGLGLHTTAYGGPITRDGIYMFYKIFLPLEMFYFASATAIKTSLILSYYRIFWIVRWFKWECLAAWIIVVLYFVVDLLVGALECSPVPFFWDKSIAGGTCIDQDQFYRWNGVANLLIDFMVLTLTLPLIWRLKLKARQKLSVSGVFLLGIFACSASIIRVTTFNQVNFEDVTWTMVDVSIWSTIEQSLGIICACLITYQPLLSRVLSRFRRNSDTGESERDPSKATEMARLGTRPNQKPSNDVSTAGFARLNEDNDIEGTVTTYVTADWKGNPMVLPKAITKSQTIEQYHQPLG